MKSEKSTVLYFYVSAFMMWRRRLSGIYAIAQREGWHVEPVDVGELKRGIRPVLNYWKPDGLIVEGGVFLLRNCLRQAFDNQKVVYCDADASIVGPKCFGVRHNSADVVKLAVRELKTRNFDSYAYVHYRTLRDWSLERESIFRREMMKLGKRVFVFESWKHPRNEDSEAFGNRLETFVRSIPMPCGVLAANDEMAAHVLRAAERAGVDIPGSMAVVGIDNDELLCENTIPTLTSVSPAFERSGKLAAGLLARWFRVPALRPIVLGFGSMPLVRRHSTRQTERVDIRAVRAIEFIRTNACKGIVVADVVRQMGMKKRTAESRFREVAKRSIRDEIVAVRIARAKELLRNSKLCISDIYLECGYRDPRCLRAAFTKATGWTLSQWRSKMRE